MRGRHAQLGNGAHSALSLRCVSPTWPDSLRSLQGLGKTVISLACVLAAPQEATVTAAKQAAYAAAIAAATSSAAKKKVPVPTHATLVVCAVSLVGQWCAEVQSKLSADSALKIHMCTRPLDCAAKCSQQLTRFSPQIMARVASRTPPTWPPSTSW